MTTNQRNDSKFEFTGETRVEGDVTLRRIRALVPIKFAAIGDLGGLIQNEQNLSGEGDAWVSGNARVSGNAQVSGDAWVYGNALVSGNARVYGDALVSKNTNKVEKL